MDDERNDEMGSGDDDALLGEALGRFGELKEEPGDGEGLLGEPMEPRSASADMEPLIAPPRRNPVGGNVKVGREAAKRGGGLAVAGGALAGALLALGVVKFVFLPGIEGRMAERLEAVELELAQKKPPEEAADSVPEVVSGEVEERGLDEKLLGELEEQLGVLKLRNRLTDLADRAIVLGERNAYQVLKAALSDEEHATARTAVRSELLRVEYFYSSGSRLKGYVLPVAKMFPDAGVEGERDLTEEQVIGVLKDHGQPWKARARSAWLLGERPSATATGALVEAMLAEVNLDVMKECQYSFEEITGFRGEALFDTLGVESWWKQIRATAGPGQ